MRKEAIEWSISPTFVGEITSEISVSQTGLQADIWTRDLRSATGTWAACSELDRWLTNIYGCCFSFDFDKLHASGDFVLPVLQIIGKYEAEGRILLLPLNGKGDLNITLGKNRTRCNMQFKYAWSFCRLRALKSPLKQLLEVTALFSNWNHL
jgi:hypothetical protein